MGRQITGDPANAYDCFTARIRVRKINLTSEQRLKSAVWRKTGYIFDSRRHKDLTQCWPTEAYNCCIPAEPKEDCLAQKVVGIPTI